jgi:hypothetical protein
MMHDIWWVKLSLGNQEGDRGVKLCEDVRRRKEILSIVPMGRGGGDGTKQQRCLKFGLCFLRDRQFIFGSKCDQGRNE